MAGALAAAYLTILVLQLNPAFPLRPGAVVPLLLRLAAVYGVVVVVVCYAIVMARQVTAARQLSPGWLSVRLLSWLGLIVASAAATLMWLNVRGFGNVLDVETARRMAAGALAMTAASALFLVLAVAHLGRRGGGVSAGLLTLTIAGSLVLPVLARGPSRSVPRSSGLAAAPGASPGLEQVSPDARVIMLMLDGASLDVIQPAVAAGRLPGFGRILDRGAVVHLATLRPTQAEPVWSAVATGRLPMANGVRSAARYRVAPGAPPIDLLPDYCYAQALSTIGVLHEEAQTSASLATRPVWSIIGDYGMRVGIIGWPVTHPALPVNGFLVSDQFHRLPAARLATDGAAAITPPTLLDAAREAVTRPITPDPVLLGTLPPPDLADDHEPRREPEPEPEPLLADRVHLQLARTLMARLPARFTAVRLPGVDAVGHYYLRFANPAPFGDVTEEERQRYGRVLETYYAFLDGIVGDALGLLGPDDLLLVVSAFGMEPLSPGKRLLEQITGNAGISGTHERAPDGFLLAFGRGVAPSRPGRASVLDITPTILYYLGLPVGRDMDGFARADLFDPAFTAEHPITYIPTHER